MSPIKFNSIFYFLMGAAALSAFVIPQQYTDKVEPQVQSLFYPVSTTARWAGFALERRLGAPEPVDPRPVASIRKENDRLALEVARLSHELDELRKINLDRDALGELRRYCTPVPVVGNDAGNRDSLAVGGSSFQGIQSGMAVVYGGDLVGTLQRAGMGGGQVQLVTNKDFKATAYFIYFEETPHGRAPVRLNENNHFLVRGVGQGMMVCEMVHMDEAANWRGRGVRPGDLVMLEDRDWPQQLQACRIGTVVSVGKRKDAPLFAEIRIRPEKDLKRLREVMVLTKQ